MQGWAAGTVVDGYRVVRQLGAGGMGQVFEGVHVHSGHRVAIKVLPLGSDVGLLERFRREAEAQARVDAHPNVVKIHSVGEAGGHAYLVMDLASGGDLQARLEVGRPEPLEAARIVRDLARGLHHAHLQGVLHRDLKPANVLLDEQGVPKLVDFGLARLVGEQRLTHTGELLGTPAYMAPEQANGTATDTRTDVYGLGGVLYAALTGKSPHSKGSVVATLSAVLHDPVVSPEAALGAKLPKGLQAVCLTALAKSPDDRYPTAAAFADALTEVLEGTAPSPGRRRALALAYVAGVLTAGCLGLGLQLLRPSAEPVSDVEEAPPPVLTSAETSGPEAHVGWLLNDARAALARGDRSLAAGQLELAHRLAPLRAARADPELWTALLELAARTLRKADADDPSCAPEVAQARERLLAYRIAQPRGTVDPQVLADVRRLGASRYLNVALAARPGAWYLARSFEDMDAALDEVGEFPNAKSDRRQTWPASLMVFRKSLGSQQPKNTLPFYEEWVLARPEFSFAWTRLANTHHNAGNMSLAALCYQGAVELEPSSYVRMLYGISLARVNRWEAARGQLAEALARDDFKSDSDRRNNLYWLAQVEARLGRHEDALKRLQSQAPEALKRRSVYWTLQAYCLEGLGRRSEADFARRQAQRCREL